MRLGNDNATQEVTPEEYRQASLSVGPLLLFVIGWFALLWGVMSAVLAIHEDMTPHYDSGPHFPVTFGGLFSGAIGLLIAISCFVSRKRSIREVLDANRHQ